MIRRLSHEINDLKMELYETLSLEQSLNSHRAYILSLKLDKLICEYEHTNFSKKAQKNAAARMNY